MSEYTDLLTLSTSKVLLQVPMRRLELASMLIIDASEADLAVLSVMIKERKKCIKDTIRVNWPSGGAGGKEEPEEPPEEPPEELKEPEEQAESVRPIRSFGNFIPVEP